MTIRVNRLVLFAVLVVIAASLVLVVTRDRSVAIGPGMDHMKCYKAKGITNKKLNLMGLTHLTDILESKLVDVIKLKEVCTAAEIYHGSVETPPDMNVGYACYKIRDAKELKQPKFVPTEVEIDTRYEGEAEALVKKAGLLCVPTTIFN